LADNRVQHSAVRATKNGACFESGGRMLRFLVEPIVAALPAFILLILIMIAKSRRDVGAAALLFALYLVDALCLQISHWLPQTAVAGTHWNWSGKIASALFALGALSVLPQTAFNQVGLFRWPEPSAWLRILVILAFIVGFAVARGQLGHEPFSLETLAFQATMPGLAEETAYRGVWWIVLALALDRPAIDNGTTPWSTLIVISLLFASVHSISLSESGAVLIDAPAAAATALAATLYGLLQSTGRALWLTILAHNLSNVILFVLQTT